MDTTDNDINNNNAPPNKRQRLSDEEQVDNENNDDNSNTENNEEAKEIALRKQRKRAMKLKRELEDLSSVRFLFCFCFVTLLHFLLSSCEWMLGKEKHPCVSKKIGG